MTKRSWILWRRGARITVLVLGLLVVSSVTGTFVALTGSLPPVDGREEVVGVLARVDVERDANGRVTVRAQSREDLAFGLGYAHGQDRFFQMDLQRRAGEGTLAALIGRPGIDLDKGARRHDLAGTARATLTRISLSERAVLESYARGVNAGLSSLRARPWEYFALRHSPRPWRAIDTFHVVLAMYRDLQDENNRLERALATASRVLDPAVFALFTAEAGPWEAPIEGEAGPGPSARIAARGPVESERGPVRGPRAEPGVPTESAPRGSNSFAVAGSLSVDGRALLSNDMHLGLGVPNIWYAARLVVEGSDPLDAVGVTLPGSPGLVVGSNGALAWGFTNSYGDWLDHVVLEVDPSDSTRYRQGDGWQHFVVRREQIDVAGAATVELEVRQTVWGPVVGSDPEGRLLALRWTAQDPEALNLRLLDMMEQRTLEDALDLAPRCGVPHQNLVVATADGRIAWTLLGRVPRRVGFDGSRPVSWADGSAGWVGWLEPGEVPRIADPSHGRLWTANARVLSLEDQRVLGDGGYAVGARAQRIRERLFARERFDEAALLSIQFDVQATLMTKWFEVLLTLVERETELADREQILAVLADWKGEPAVDSVSYRLVREWRSRLLRDTMQALGAPLEEATGEDLVWSLPRLETALWALVRDRPEWVPEPHASWEEFERVALLDVLAEWGTPETWATKTWGARNALTVRHPLSPVLPPWLQRVLDLPELAVPGDSFVPRVDGRGFGASERMVVAPGAEARGILALPGGSNAHPFSRWRNGDYIAWSRGDAVPMLPGETMHTRVLVPHATR